LYGSLVLWGYVEALVGWQPLIDWVYDHETLTTGFLAVGSALVGSWFLHRQTAQAERHEQQRRASRREAIRTVLPLALSVISRYAVASGKATKVLLDQCVGESLSARDVLTIPALPVLPAEAISTLKEMAEFLNSAEVRYFAIMLAGIQVQASRLAATIERAGDEERLEVKFNLEEYIIDCAMIYARAANLFDFARGATDTVPAGIRWTGVAGALFSFDMLSDDYPRIEETMLRRSGNDMDAWVKPRWESAG